MSTNTAKWQFQEAKNKFSEVVRKAIKEGPQLVTNNGKDSVVVLSSEDYRKLEKPNNSLVDFFQKSPLRDAYLDVERDASPARNVDESNI